MTHRLIEAVAMRVRVPERRTDSTDLFIPEIGPLVSEEQLARCEASLGIRLPGLLRRLYSEIGNGGFGPGYGIFPVPNGRVTGLLSIVSLYEEFRKPSESKPWEWPPGLLPICDWGCLIYSCVGVSPSEQPVFTSTEYGVQPTRWTLETWLSDWASNVDLWEVLINADPSFALHPVTGRPMEYNCE
jgi:hypothetical protein